MLINLIFEQMSFACEFSTLSSENPCWFWPMYLVKDTKGRVAFVPFFFLFAFFFFVLIALENEKFFKTRILVHNVFLGKLLSTPLPT